MMAISRHTPEWKHTIATAYLAGVRFRQVSTRYWQSKEHWLAIVNDPYGLIIPGVSKIEVARKALDYLARKGAPDAAFERHPELKE